MDVLGGSVVGFVMKFCPKVVVAIFDAGAGTLFGDGRKEMCGLFRGWGGWCKATYAILGRRCWNCCRMWEV